MMAGRGGGVVSNLVFVHHAFSPPPPSFLRTLVRTSKGSDLFYEAFKREWWSPTKEKQGALMNNMTHSHMFVYKLMFSCFDHHKYSFLLLIDT